MDQKNSQFYDAGDFDHSKVDLTKLPETVEEYMQMVVVDRERCPDVVVADLPEEKLQPTKQRAPLVMPDDSQLAPCQFAPGPEWNKKKSNAFSLQRSIIEGAEAPEAETGQIKELNWAAPTDRKRWMQLCFEQRPSDFPLSPQFEGIMAHHRGTPPTLSLIKCLDDNLISCLLVYQIDYLNEHGPSRAVMEWIYALMLAVKKPILHDVCSSMREMARHFWRLRSELGEENMELVHQYSLFIALVSIYFGQRDLAD